MQLTIQNLSFTHEGSAAPVFEGLSAQLDTSWRLGLIARNGRGKTTLLHLIDGRYPYQGRIDCPLTPSYFPFDVPDASRSTLYVMQQCAPEVQDWQLLREMSLLGLDKEILDRSFSTLSQGEQTKALLAALFSRDDLYPLIDEPTNHLDAHGRAQVADYLRRKDGFLLVSHDRAFLNRCIDHVFTLNREGSWVMQGNYDTYEARLNLQTETEQARDESLRRDIRRLEQSARRTAEHSQRIESRKIGIDPTGSYDKQTGIRPYLGAKSQKLMKRSQAMLRRQESAIEEKKTLLHNAEQVGQLKLTNLTHPKKTLLRVQDGEVRYPGRTVLENIAFEVNQGDRVALTGPNGCGKSSILKTLVGASDALQGRIVMPTGLILSYVPQSTASLRGDLRSFIRNAQVDETLMKAILRNMDFSRELFDRPLETMSQGQKKKVLLARSLCTPAHLYLWDEPLNYIDVFSRVQLEELILSSCPSLLLVEHDAVFLDRVCNRPAIQLDA